MKIYSYFYMFKFPSNVVAYLKIVILFRKTIQFAIKKI